MAGDLAWREDHFTTASGREVALRIYAERKDLDKLDHAMVSLKKAMRWDEAVYGREYDLDIYMIVAVDFFNMGAMENKGLNIFNTACVLAHPKTTTRCRPFSASRRWWHMSISTTGPATGSPARLVPAQPEGGVYRLSGRRVFRRHELAHAETDRGCDPVAHRPVRRRCRPHGPSGAAGVLYRDLQLLYLTVYEKGAEVVRMLHTCWERNCFARGVTSTLRATMGRR